MIALSASQRAHAQAIVDVAKRRRAPQRRAIIAIATALVESGLRNYANSNVPASLRIAHDAVGNNWASLGVFQQQTGTKYALAGRTTMGSPYGWGPPSELMDVAKSATLFYDALARVHPDSMSIGAAAQAVQRSAFPDRYQLRAADATGIVDTLWGADGDNPSSLPTWLRTVTAGRCPAAIWEPVTGHDGGPMLSHDGAVMHVNESNGDIHDYIQRSSGDSAVSSHFQVMKDGRLLQYLNTGVQSWCQRNGNSRWVSIEAEGFTTEPLTVPALEAFAKCLAWLHLEHGIPLVLAENPATDRGFGWHGMGAAHGLDWGHATCPGTIRRGQRAEILRRASAYLNAPPDLIEGISMLTGAPTTYAQFRADRRADTVAGIREFMRTWAEGHTLATYFAGWFGHGPREGSLIQRTRDAQAKGH